MESLSPLPTKKMMKTKDEKRKTTPPELQFNHDDNHAIFV
jgi:hypothetical protein